MAGKRSRKSISNTEAKTTVADENASPHVNKKSRMSAPATPATPDASLNDSVSSVFDGASPARRKRIEEKDELQALNKRFEYYILKRREQETFEGGHKRELDMVKTTHEREVKTLSSKYEGFIEQLRGAREEQAELINNLKESLQRLKAEVEQLKVEKKLARELEASTRTRNDTVMKKYKDSQLALLTATEQAKDAMHSLQNLTAQNKDLMSDLAELKTLSQNNTKKAIDNESKWQNVKDDYDFLKQKSASELKDLHEQVAALSRDRAEVEDELRKEFGKQLKDILRDRQNQFEADKTAGLEALRKAFEEKNAARADELLAAVKENDKLANRVVALEDDLAEAEQQAQKAQGEVAASQRQIEVMQIQVHKANERHQTQVRDLVATVEAGKEARIKKQKDFDDLVDVNVTLEMEIKAYRLLIENEENRLGLD